MSRTTASRVEAREQRTELKTKRKDEIRIWSKVDTARHGKTEIEFQGRQNEKKERMGRWRVREEDRKRNTKRERTDDGRGRAVAVQEQE